jgi:hypothetical protein
MCEVVFLSVVYFTAKIELELASVLSGRRETERRQDGFDRV